MKISKIVSEMTQSFTRQLFDKAKEYDNVIDFTLGDPDLRTPAVARNAGCDAIMSGKTRYSANAGLLELREAIATYIEREDGVLYNPAREIIVTAGAMEALYLCFCSMIDPGDEVILLAPYWVNYYHMIKMCGGVPVIVDTQQKDADINIKAIQNAITKKTVAVVVNTPNNPTGKVYSAEKLQELCELAENKKIMLIADQCYRSIVFEPVTYYSILKNDKYKEHIVLIDSCSKQFAMTGWRIGFAAASEELITNMVKLQENIVACAPLPSQYAAIEAYRRGMSDVLQMKQKYEERRNFLLKELELIPKLRCTTSDGTFYAWIDISDTGWSSKDFAFALLEQQQVAVVPGVTYGENYDNYIRVAFTLNIEQIKEGMQRIKTMLKEDDYNG